MSVPASEANALSACKICTIRLEELRTQRAWWFRAFREKPFAEPASGTPLAVLIPIQEWAA